MIDLYGVPVAFTRRQFEKAWAEWACDHCYWKTTSDLVLSHEDFARLAFHEARCPKRPRDETPHTHGPDCEECRNMRAYGFSCGYERAREDAANSVESALSLPPSIHAEAIRALPVPDES